MALQFEYVKDGVTYPEAYARIVGFDFRTLRDGVKLMQIHVEVWKNSEARHDETKSTLWTQSLSIAPEAIAAFYEDGGDNMVKRGYAALQARVPYDNDLDLRQAVDA